MSNDNELSFDEAFALFADGKEPEVKKPEDTSTEAEVSNTEEEPVVKSEEETDTTADQELGQDDSPKTLEEAMARATLWEQRFKSFEGRVQAEMERRREEELLRQKQFVDALSNTQTKTPSGEDTKPGKFQHLATEYPEIAEAVQELLDSKLKETSSQFQRVIEEKVMPIATDFSQHKAMTHSQRILAKHPDAMLLRQNGSLDAWINMLPPFAQVGAKYVITSGTSDEVVALLDQYKDYNKQKTNQNTDKLTTTDTGTKEPSPGMVEAVKAGLAVKSGRSNDPKTEAKKSTKDDFDAGWEQALKDLGIS